MAELLLLIAAFAGAAFTAWVIGANSASPSFGPATSAGAVNILRASLIVGVAAFLGAVLQGGYVTDTIGNQLVAGISFGTLEAAVILLTASTMIAASIAFKYPMPTAFTVMGSVIGVGVAAGGTVDGATLRTILSFWLIIPFVGITIGFVTARGFMRYVEKNEVNTSRLRWAVLGLGAYTAFTAGANQSGLIVGPLLNAVSVDPFYLLVFAGVGIVVGAWTGSPKIIESVSREYSRLGPRRAIAALLAASLIAQVATLYGVPVSFNEAIIAAVIGSGLAKGSSGVSRRKIGWTVVIWVVASFSAVAVSYAVASIALAL